MTESGEQVALIEARGAAFSYDAGEPALEGLDFTLAGGAFVVLLGPNAGGKTTLFRALSGELAPVAGMLSVTGRIAMLPQNDRTRLDYPVSALDVVLMGTLARGRWWQRPDRHARAAAREALEFVGLGDRERTLFGELSGGQRRRVLIARTVVQDAPIVALDEPLAGVDPASGAVIQRAMQRMSANGKLVLVTSHDIDQARGADRVLCLNRRQTGFGDPGAVLTEATLRDTYEAELTVIGVAEGGRVVTTVQHHDHAH